MSQFNSGPDLERAFPAATTQRVRIQAPGRVGVEESLAAPGLVALPPVSRGAELAGQVMTALGLAGAAGQAIGSYAEGETLDLRRQSAETQARLERESAARAKFTNEIDQQRRGAGGLHARTRSPVLEAAIAERRMLIPDGVSVEQHVASLVAQETDGFPAPYAEAYKSVVAPRLAEAFTRQQLGIRTEAKADSLRLLGEAAITAPDTAGIAAQIDAAKTLYPDLSETEVLASVALPALETAANAGDAAKVEATLAALGDRFPSEQLKARSILATQQGQQARVREDAARQSVFRLLNEGQPFEIAQARVESLRKEGMLPEDTAASLTATIAAREEESNRDAVKLLLQQERRATEDKIIAAAESAMLSAGESGGAANINDVTFTGSDNVERVLSKKEIVETATTNAMVRFQQTAATPEEALADQVQFLSDNGVTFPQWERTMAAGYLAVANDFATDPTKPLPANIAVGYDLYRRMAVMNPRLANDHLKNDQARTFYDATLMVERFIAPGKPNTALLMVATAFNKPDVFSSEMAGSLNRREFDAAVKDASTRGWGLWKTEARNSATIGANIEQVARFYVRLGLNPSDAIEEAKKKVKDNYVLVNGYAVDIGNRRVPTAFPQIAERIAADYAAKHPDEVMNARDLVLLPGETEGSWVLKGSTDLVPVENLSDGGFFTNADLDRLNTQYDTADRQAIADKVIARNAVIQAARGPAAPEPFPGAIDRMFTRPNLIR